MPKVGQQTSLQDLSHVALFSSQLLTYKYKNTQKRAVAVTTPSIHTLKQYTQFNAGV